MNNSLKVRKVVGFTGRVGTGKDEAAKVLSDRCQAHLLSVGDIIREIAAKRGIEKNRQNYHSITEEYYQEEGPGYFIHQII